MSVEGSSVAFSVVIPLYNKVDTIKRALRSVAEQRFDDFELIVVDDGSTDASAEAVESFINSPTWQARGKILKLVRQANAGVSAARNRGGREANGRYVAFLDGDDCWHPNFLKSLSGVVEKFTDSVIVGSGFYWFRADGCCKTRESGRIEKVDLIAETAYFQPVHSSSVAVRREELLSVGGFVEGHGFFEDLELLFKLSLAYPKRAAVVRRALAYHIDDAAFTITKTLTDKERGSPHLDLLENACVRKSESILLFSMRYFTRRLASNLVHSRIGDNRRMCEDYPKLLALCGLKTLFTNARLRYIAFALAMFLLF